MPDEAYEEVPFPLLSMGMVYDERWICIQERPWQDADGYYHIDFLDMTRPWDGPEEFTGREGDILECTMSRALHAELPSDVRRYRYDPEFDREDLLDDRSDIQC